MALFRNSFRLLTTGIAFLVIGIVLTVMTAGDIIDNAKTPVDYNTLQMEDFKAGMMVEGDLLDNYGWYETVTRENDNGTKTTVGYYYLIDAGDEGLMGLYTPMKDLIGELNAQEEEGNDYYNGYSDINPAPSTLRARCARWIQMTQGCIGSTSPNAGLPQNRWTKAVLSFT